MSEKQSVDGTTIPSDLPEDFRETLAAGDASHRAVDTDRADDDRRDDTGQTQSVADYANRAGRVNHEKLREAMRDWQSGTIDRTMLDEVIDAFRTGERVVEKEVITIDQNIGTDKTLEPNPNSDGGEAVVYHFPTKINVTADLTIESGVVMEFEEGAGLELTDSSGYGAIMAEGTTSDPILLTGTNPRPGWWDSVTIDTWDPRNTMAHVVVEYGGQTGTFGDEDGRGNVRINEGRIEVRECELRRSRTYGLAFSDTDGKLLDHEGEGSGSNSYLGNQLGAVYTRFENVHMLSADSTYTSSDPLRRNDEEYVFVDGGSASGRGRDLEERTMENLGVPYRVDGEVDIDRLTWTIEPGTTLEFTEESGLSASGRFVCQGTAVAPIRFTGVETQRGSWQGIDDVSEDSGNVMEHCIVEYGGGDSTGPDGNIELLQSSLKMHNCTFRHSARYGVDIRDAEIDAADNVYTDNSAGPVRVRTAHANQLSGTSEFTGNDNDYVSVTVQDIDGSNVVGEFTWEGLDVPYRMAGEEYNINRVEWTIEPGVTLEFEEGGWLDLGPDSDLTFEGEPGNEITFTGTQEERGWWGALFVETDSAANTLRHAVVEYGGNGFGGGVRMKDGSTLHVEHCTFRHNDGYGLHTENVTLEPLETEMQENVYTDNADGAVRTRTPSASQLSDSSEFTGNDDDHVYVKGGADVRLDRITGEFTWDAIGVPYRVSGEEHRFFDLHWTIEAGATLEVEENGEFNLQDGCKLTFEGESGNEITFTGTKDQQGWWGKLYVQSYSQTNTMVHTVIENAGGGDSGAVRLDDGRFDPMENCIIRMSGSEGLYVKSNATDQINDACNVNTFENNAGTDCFFEE